MSIYGFIFARGGSKGLPGKNIKELCGKPLIAWAIEAGKATGLLDRIIVSTDSEEIAAVARAYGAETPFLRPKELASDTAPENLSWRHAINFLRNRGDSFDTMVSLPATAPLRTPESVIKSIEIYREGGCDAVVVCKEASRSPYFNMVKLDDNGYADVVIRPSSAVGRRQDCKPVYDMTTIAYVTSPDFALNNPYLWDGKVKIHLVDRVTGLDIDDALDFELAEYFMAKRLEKADANN